jgi:hypothetical protein
MDRRDFFKLTAAASAAAVLPLPILPTKALIRPANTPPEVLVRKYATPGRYLYCVEILKNCVSPTVEHHRYEGLRAFTHFREGYDEELFEYVVWDAPEDSGMVLPRKYNQYNIVMESMRQTIAFLPVSWAQKHKIPFHGMVHLSQTYSWDINAWFPDVKGALCLKPHPDGFLEGETEKWIDPFNQEDNA